MNVSAAIADVQAKGTGLEASGEDFRSETRLFPLAPSLTPLAWTVGTISRRTAMNNAGLDSMLNCFAVPLCRRLPPTSRGERCPSRGWGLVGDTGPLPRRRGRSLDIVRNRRGARGCLPGCWVGGREDSSCPALYHAESENRSAVNSSGSGVWWRLAAIGADGADRFPRGRGIRLQTPHPHSNGPRRTRS